MSRTRMIVLAVAVGVVVAAGVALVLVRSGDDGTSPAATATAFAAAWSDGDTDAMQALVADSTPTIADQLEDVTGGLRADRQEHEVVGEAEGLADGEVQVAVRSTYVLAGLGEWEVVHPITLREIDGDSDRRWAVVWEAATVHPDLDEGQRLRSTREWAERAPILGAGDQPIAGPQPSVIVGAEPQRVTDRDTLTTALEASLGIDPEAVDRALDAPGVQPDHFVALATIRRSVYEEVRDRIHPVPGTVFRETDARGAPTPEFARHVIGRVDAVTAERLEELGEPYIAGDLVGLSGLEARHERQLAGEPSGTVEIVDDTGTVTELHRFPGAEPQPVRTTIDPAVQAAVEATIGDRNDPLAIVVVGADNSIRAVASRPLGEIGRALSGQYPPGSTFKVVTAASLLDHGVTPTLTLDCPASVVVDGREFSNFESDALGPVTFEEAFVQSCNTAFISAAAGLPDGALVSTADEFGFNAEYSIGVPVAASRVPEPAGATEQAATAIGQAGILATPLHMATVAATVMDGVWEHPTLVADAAAGSGSDPIVALDDGQRTTLDTFMAAVVERGTASAARSVRGLRGKTGTAEFGTDVPPRTHAWFIGHRGALAVAILLEGGGVGGEQAAPLAVELFAQLDAGG